MKRVLAAVFCFASLLGNAQLMMTKLDGTPINNGDIFTFTELTEPGAYLGLKIYNTSEENDMLFKARVVDITNSNGANLQLCVGDVCLMNITEGSAYPSFAASLPPGGENSNFDHFVNYNAGIDTSLPVEYVIRIFQINESGAEIGNSVQFTYRYQPQLSTGEFSPEAIGIVMKSNFVGDLFELTSAKTAKLELFDMTGKMVSRAALSAGQNAVDVSSFGSGVYIATFTTDEGKTATAKIVRK
jgi:hypothetical protein